jgi:aminomethyltransferase
MGATQDVLQRTPFYDRHLKLGAKLASFAGWDMPIEYVGIRPEHLAVRKSVGIFDVSHMGQIEIIGPDSEAFLQRVFSNDVTKLMLTELPQGGWLGGSQYGLLCKEDGGVLDDLIAYKLGPERYLVVTNAANHIKDLAWMEKHSTPYDVTLVDRITDYSMLAVQGPDARSLISALTQDELPARLHTRWSTVAGVEDVLICGTGYTGEDGVELIIPVAGSTKVWDALFDSELSAIDPQPVGLGARDTLRLEACFHLYGNDLSEQRGPIEVGLSWCCKEETGFIGADKVRAAREKGPSEKLVPFAITSGGIARPGNQVIGGGVITSGTFSPCLELGIGFVYLPVEKAVVGNKFEIDVRGRIRTAEVRKKPLYSKEK